MTERNNTQSTLNERGSLKKNTSLPHSYSSFSVIQGCAMGEKLLFNKREKDGELLKRTIKYCRLPDSPLKDQLKLKYQLKLYK